MEKELTALREAEKKFKEILELASEYGIEAPRHSEITIFDDGDFRIEVKKGFPQGEMSKNGSEKLKIRKLLYKEESDKDIIYRKLKQDEPPASSKIIEEREI